MSVPDLTVAQGRLQLQNRSVHEDAEMSTTIREALAGSSWSRGQDFMGKRLEDAWNTRDPAKVALVYAIDSRWRNRSEFINGRNEIIAFFSRKWANELDYKELWALLRLGP